MEQQPQATKETQDENQEGELRTETKYIEDVPLKKVKYTSQCFTVNKKEVLKHLLHFHSVVLIGKKEKVRQTCGKLKKQYNEVVNHFKTITVCKKARLCFLNTFKPRIIAKFCC